MFTASFIEAMQRYLIDVQCNAVTNLVRFAAQVLSAAGAAWFIGGDKADVNRLLQVWQPDGSNSTALQWAHFPAGTWQLDHWESVPAGGDPSSAYMGKLQDPAEPPSSYAVAPTCLH